ncbi:MAG: hypothetical protein F7C35_01545 [Desulfurococcales archaeon]|nr:hypothetical protein [Desulfurococcales archaeon]
MGKGRLTRVYAIALIIAFLVSTLPLTILTISAKDSLMIRVSGEAIKELGLQGGYLVNIVTLTIPGVTVLTPDKVDVDQSTGELVVEFEGVIQYIQQATRAVEGSNR